MDEGKIIEENEGESEKRKPFDDLENKMEFISNFVLRVLRIKSEKWQKLIQSEERLTLNKFVDESNIPLLTFALGHGGLLQVALGFPPSPRSKIVYFIRQVYEVITPENCQKILIAGEVSDQMVSELTVFTEEIITPLLCNSKNHKGWPEIIVDDVKKHVSNFKNTLYQIRGELYNEIVLPMPNGAEKIDHAVDVLEKSCGHKLDMYLKSNIEGIIIQWAFQVNNVLIEKMAVSINNKIFPSPMDNVDYWVTRLKNLEGIYSQLRHPRVKKMARYLEMSRSVYLDSFKTILTKLIAGVVETRDIVLHQIPLKKHFESFESIELSECKPIIRPMMHCITLLWINSRYYRKNERIIDLLRNVCNLIIQKSVSSFNQQNIFIGEASEQVQKIISVLQIIQYFTEIYEINRKKIGTHFPMGSMPVYWTFDNTQIFYRLNEFTNRLKMVKLILQTTVEMFKLEKVEFAGIRGRGHSLKTLRIYEQYIKLYNDICNIEYDPLNTEDESFKADYKRFTLKVLDIDRSLAKLFSEAYDECSNLEHRFKLLHVIGDLGKRPRIFKELQARLENLTNLIDDELHQVTLLFDDGIEKYENNTEPIIDLNFPPVVGFLWWIHELRQRATIPMIEYKQIEILNSCNEKYNETQKKYDILSENLDRIEKKYFDEWVSNVPLICEKYLNTPLLIKDGRFIKLNFSYELVILLCEIRYISFLDKYTIPPEGKILFERNEKLQSAIRKLNLAILWYNKLQTGHITEMSLIENELSNIDALLEKGINELNWNIEVNEYIDDVFTTLEELENRVLTAQNNLKRVFDLTIEINNFGMYEGYQSKKGGTSSYKTTRYNKIESFNSEMTKVLNDNYRLYFKVKELVLEEDVPNDSKLDLDIQNNTKSQNNYIHGPEKWINYVKFIDNQVCSAVINTVTTSLKVLLANMNSEIQSSNIAFMEIDAVLQQPNIIFEPSLETSNVGLKSIIVQMIDDIINQSKIFKNIFNGDDAKKYLSEVEKNQDISSMKNNILAIVESTIDDIHIYVQLYEAYSYIWIDDRYECLDLFLKYGKVVTKKTLEQSEQSEEADDEILSKRPTLDMFKDQIDVFENLYAECDLLPETHLFSGWLKLNLRGLKQGLLNLVRKWSNVFKQDLMNYVMDRLCNLDDFIEITTNNLSIELVSYDGLIRVMDSIIKVRERKEWGTEQMFDPLRDQIELLKTYGVEFPEETFDQEGKKKHSVYTLIEVLPEKWKNLIKLSNIVKHNVGPLQVNQAHLISKQITLFSIKMQQYRNEFKCKILFSLNCEDIYDSIDKTHLELIHYEEAIISLNKSCELFDVTHPDSRLIEICRKELTMAKELWDYYFLILNTIEDWKKTPWKNIDAEGMDMECKRFSKDLKSLDKEIRHWEPYISIENIIKNLLTSLRAVTELQNPAIRERHWIELMQATDRAKNEIEAKELVAIQMDDGTTLASLLSLNLHKYEDEVKNIVDKSIKEGAMEKILRELNMMWNNMEFEYEDHERTNLKIPKANEDLIETLEDNQTQVQNMMASKFVGHFEQEVTEWQKKLSNADQCISVWFEVQRKWMYLESIFVESDDIRNQLPEDSNRFDSIDIEFKNIVVEIQTVSNVIAATNMPGLYERLDKLLFNLIICEKALNDYLETKRLAYPRFYFVSSADLLDILSNGNTPDLVCKHLIKLYDNLAKLVFMKENKVKNGTNHYAGEMVSKENNEHVKFKNICNCSGKVEVWLNRVTSCMRETLHELLNCAVNAYEEKPRDAWLFDWAAQIALVGTQIWWTIETNQAFFRLEEGYENALKEYQKKQIIQLNALIILLLGDLSAGDRQKIMTICTIDVHSRDVIAKMIALKVESSTSFMWQSQLRLRWDNTSEDCFGNICDAQFQYAYEYLGNTPRLVITPLTDRCYITLTQSLHLVMGGAPAGPAGTGKTETTKDLGRALGVMVYVFNCSEQMDYKSCGNIYKGLAQTGAWGCFDEFNRISLEVLSVVSVQVKSIQDAIKNNKSQFSFMGDEIFLNPTVGIFITMNPGYAGRTELPENIKSLFRPCAMVVPDFELICEIMLVAEGFQDARILARKFITLYTLCKELLSKQDHYDWGLRAIKSVLVIAGSLKRGDRERPEDQVLMRALRDFNIPKIITDDVPVFMGLIGDLFPALDVPRKRNIDFEKMCQAAAIDMKLQPEPGFILKIVQLAELFAVRHSVFIIGLAGTGKTCVWKCLFRTYQMAKLKPYYNDLDPKAVTNDELFGVINPATREWKDGLFSVIMRDTSNMSGEGAKWIVLDGDIDPMWIESLNTLMDDNKILTLASNERISLTKSMRLLFEISNLQTATPATVSRAGILYINPQDLGWNPYVTSWIDSRDDPVEKSTLSVLFDKYIPSLLETSKKFKKITNLTEIQQVQMVTYLLECFLTKQNMPHNSPKEWYEIYFVFCCIWSFGSALYQDQLIDWRAEFMKWFTTEFKSIVFPSNDNIFDYYVDPVTKTFLPWSDKVEKLYFDPDVPLQQCLVSTVETTRLRFFMDLLLAKKHPVMLVGGVGCGKSVIVTDKLSSLPDNYAVKNVPFNFYTTSDMLQKVLEKPLEKKSGRNFGPPGNKTLIYFVDDMNMPEVDKYGTVQPHTIIRQFMNYKHWYDRTKLSLKDIHNCQFVSCMNPTAGSFVIDSRLLRHFCVFAVSFPSAEACHHIYHQILSAHFSSETGKFLPALHNITLPIVQAAVNFHTRISAIFLPTALKFHYIFNMRDLANIFQGILYATCDTLKCPSDLVRLWMHESTRVYCDKLVNEKDVDTFNKILLETVKKGFEELDEGIIYEKPLIYCHFAEGIGDPKYSSISTWNQLTKLLTEGLHAYNDMVATMNLVLFEDAMNHICRINRILELPRGNALLIGVGGSGKQSLSRLSSFLSGLEVFQIQLRKGYSVQDLKSDLATIYIKTGLKNIGTVFLMTDAQVADEKFLVLINDLLASGEIPDLFADEEIENIINGVRTETKATGMMDTKDNCWKFFIDRVRRQLKVVLCFSPVGTTLRIRSRKFPAIINCTSIDWFHEWPQEALRSVSKRFLSELNELSPNLVEPVSLFMSHVHTSVNNISLVYFQKDRRYNYTTPKSFLEQISLYSKLLKMKTSDLKLMISRLENGLLKLNSCAKDVEKLKVTLAEQEINLKLKNKAAEELISVVGAESDRVAKEKAFAAEEEKKVKVIEEDVSIKAKICADDLAKAEPALTAAQEALNTLNKNNLTELKSFGTPPDAVVNVTAAVSVLLSKFGKIPKDRSWKACKVMMAKVDQFLNDLVNYDKENIHPDVVKAIQPFIKDPDFLPETILSKSSAAAGLCAWVINIMKFYEVYVIVEPKRRALIAANTELAAARSTLAQLKEKIADLEQRLAVLLIKFQEAVDEKLKCQTEADTTNATIALANRLVNGLSSEKIRWTSSVANLKDCAVMLPGDVLLVTAFISYVGCFTHKYRMDLLYNDWIPYLFKVEPKIPLTDNIDPLMLMTDDAQIASWNNEGLPSDRMSAENATILTHSARWPLIIDPQLQGVKWIKNHYGDDLKVVRTTSQIEVIEQAIFNGDVLLIENISESVDAVLDPLLGRFLIKKGKVIKIGDKEIDFNPSFKLILQTKLANPHYQPEMQAQCTVINFTVTRNGLEEQLLGDVVKVERPDLESLKADLTKQQNDFKIKLKSLEDDLLSRLSSAGPDILSDSALVVNLETTKKTAAKIVVKVKEAKITSQKIDEAREHYRPAAERASVLYFILTDLSKINPIYQFSLKAYSEVFKDALSKSKPDKKLQQRVSNLLDSITFSVFMYTSRGLFECDKLIFLCQMAIQIHVSSGSGISSEEIDFLLRYPIKLIPSPFSWMTDRSWGGISTLSKMEEFMGLDKDILSASKRWQKFIEGEAPEKDKFPGEWKNKTPLQRLCIMRALRLDRMTYATRYFVMQQLGAKFVETPVVNFDKSFKESNLSTPIFFILSPGVDPLKDVEKLGQQLGFTIENKNFHIVSLGQGQEVVAERALDIASNKGHWVMLQNIHLVSKWLGSLEKLIERYSEGSHDDYRLFLSAEPAASPEYHIIPQGILESAIKVTNEPPTGMKANLHKALDNFSQDTLEMCSKEAEFKGILFALCYFHAVVAERRKFGPQGWNRNYPFNVGDLVISVNVLYNYLENNSRVPWEDLRYLFGEIMYGGHITDDWDRRLCRTYLSEYMQPELIDGELSMAPGFMAPLNSDFVTYHTYIDECLPSETPYLYGLHPNAEIGVLTTLSEHLFKTILEMQPHDTENQCGSGLTREEKVKAVLEDLLDKIPEQFHIQDLMSKVEERTPFIIVAFQECERMNMLMGEMKRSLREVEFGFKGELTITSEMEDLENCLFMDQVPPRWTNLAYPSQLGLSAWFLDLCTRLTELENWTGDFTLPNVIWLGGFFNPQSFLTAIMQQTARKNEWPLDKMSLNCDVTKKYRDDFSSAPPEGAYIHGLYMEGARWNVEDGYIVESRLKELFLLMPVIYVRAVTQDKIEMRNMYDCPIYKIRLRGPTYVWTFNLKTKEKPAKWTLAGVCLLLGI